MGMTLYADLKPKAEGIQINNDRVFLADLVGDFVSMADLCGRLGVTSLSDFQSYDPESVAQYIQDAEAAKAAVAAAPPIEWFDPAAALPTVRALADHYAQARYIQERGVRRKVDGKVRWEPLDRTDDLLSELKDLEMVLLHAMKNQAAFRIYIGE